MSTGDTYTAAEVLLAHEPEAAMFKGKKVKKPQEWTMKEGRSVMIRDEQICRWYNKAETTHNRETHSSRSNTSPNLGSWGAIR